jgi:hypothetical protein
MKGFIVELVRLGLLVLVCALVGCKTTDTAGNGSLASVVINGSTAEEVRQTTIAVFGWNGYSQVSDLTFERKGTKWEKLTYGSLGAEEVWIQIRVQLATKAELWQVLSCDVYVVENRGDSIMESERKLQFAKADECKKILDQIKRRLSLPKPNAS